MLRRENFVLLLSHTSWQSVWVQIETFMAVSYAAIRHKNVYVIKLDDVNIKKDKLGKKLLEVQYLDARGLSCGETAKKLDAVVNLSRWSGLTYQDLVEAYSSDVETNTPIATGVKTINNHEPSLPEPPRNLLRDVKRAIFQRKLLFNWGI